MLDSALGQQNQFPNYLKIGLIKLTAEPLLKSKLLNNFLQDNFGAVILLLLVK